MAGLGSSLGNDPFFAAMQMQLASQMQMQQASIPSVSNLGSQNLNLPVPSVLRPAEEPDVEEKEKQKDEQLKEERAKKDAQDPVVQVPKCHLHKKPKAGCKFCKRHTEMLNKEKEEKTALREKFINEVRGKSSSSGSAGSSSRNMSATLEMANTKTFNFPPLLLSHIVESSHFKTLMTLTSLEEIIDEIIQFADTVEPYQANSTSVPSGMFCCVCRLFTLGLTGYQLRKLLEYDTSMLVRCAGFLFTRFGLASDQLWPWLGEYTLDDGEFRTSKDAKPAGTIGQYVEALLTEERYYTTILPRLPATIKKQLETKLAQVPQLRKRAQANLHLLDTYREDGVLVEAFGSEGTWQAGEAIDVLDYVQSRPKIRIKFQDGKEENVHIGKVILTDSRFPAASHRPKRSRDRSPEIDWAREKGKTDEELLEELKQREKDHAVCTSGKDYAKRPVSFLVALPMEHGRQSKELAQDETHLDRSRQSYAARTRERSRSRSPPPAPKKDMQQSLEYQARMKQLFEKYGMQKPAAESTKKSDIEGADFLRLG